MNPESPSHTAPADPSGETQSEIVRRWVRRVLPWALLAFAAWLLLSWLQHASPVASGAAAPELRAELADGTAFVLEDHQGEVVVVNFWATWCPPCRAEAPTLSRAHEGLRASGGMVLGISMDGGDLVAIERAARRFGMDYPIGRVDAEVAQRFRVTQLPTTYVIAPDGHIAESFVGEVSSEELADAIEHATGHDHGHGG